MERLHPAQRPTVGEVLGRRDIAGQQLLLDVRELGGERGRSWARAAVRADQRVMSDDHPVIVRVAEHESAVGAVAAEEGVLPARGRRRFPGAVRMVSGIVPPRRRPESENRDTEPPESHGTGVFGPRQQIPVRRVVRQCDGHLVPTMVQEEQQLAAAYGLHTCGEAGQRRPYARLGRHVLEQ